MSDSGTFASDAARSSGALARAIAGAERQYVQQLSMANALGFGGRGTAPHLIHLPDDGSADDLDRDADGVADQNAGGASLRDAAAIIHIIDVDGFCAACGEEIWEDSELQVPLLGAPIDAPAIAGPAVHAGGTPVSVSPSLAVVTPMPAPAVEKSAAPTPANAAPEAPPERPSWLHTYLTTEALRNLKPYGS